MSTTTVMILCMALFAVVYSAPTSKQAAPAEDMKTAETIYRSWAPSPLLGYRSAYNLPSTILNYRTAYTMPAATIGFRSAYTMPYAYRPAAIPSHYAGWNLHSPIAYTSLSDADCL